MTFRPSVPGNSEEILVPIWQMYCLAIRAPFAEHKCRAFSKILSNGPSIFLPYFTYYAMCSNSVWGTTPCCFHLGTTPCCFHT